ncbi:helix-turn-helix domain-containing protein [Streptomyces sp. NPDC015414]|uniref:helix-turn-helix domain-containing protein n=1 Tax=Streptomyces sp. NPDC015414 TaxID=3364957 RepID=UPI0036F7CFD0
MRKIRLDRGLSLTEVAHRAEVTKGFLSQLERGLTSVFSGQTLHQFDNPGTTVSEVL